MKPILLLHGSRQTGDLLLGRMVKLQKKLEKEGYQLIAPDGPFPHPDDGQMRMWWDRQGNSYDGLDQSIALLQSVWEQQGTFVGVFGFSQGARMAHLINVCHQVNPGAYFPELKFSIMVAGYHADLPDNLDHAISKLASKLDTNSIAIPNLHVWGQADRLITPDQSQAVTQHYIDPQILTHDGGHHVPMQAAKVKAYINFIMESSMVTQSREPQNLQPSIKEGTPSMLDIKPDEEMAQLQSDELEALMAIFPDEIELLSGKSSEDESYLFPIAIEIQLTSTDIGAWPPHPVAIRFQFPPNYPRESLPIMKLIHDNNVLELSSRRVDECLRAMEDAARSEGGMPCVMACLYAAREYFETSSPEKELKPALKTEPPVGEIEDTGQEEDSTSTMPKKSSKTRIESCYMEGLKIAEDLLRSLASKGDSTDVICSGGSWKFTVGLIGKPSAGKSTFFNTATGFARQRNDGENALGGAAMAPRPFTTIDPNVGYCFVPAPSGSCPEENYKGPLSFGSSHGRDPFGRRFLPVLLKDVAGLVPGAYQGRGRGNQFLNDLTGADVLVHVVDSSGTSDSEGNPFGENSSDSALVDLAWIFKELVEWVYTNVTLKWATIQRKGRSKLMAMFSGYGQSQSLTYAFLSAVEGFMSEYEERECAMDNLSEWEEGDVYRLVSTFLGIRFPMVLALNKYDLPSSKKNVEEIQMALPNHGAHLGIPVSALSEMCFVRNSIKATLYTGDEDVIKTGEPPVRVWECLQRTLTLREPILVFPVINFETYQPLPGLTRLSVHEATLPSPGMIFCIELAGGTAPSHWNSEKKGYIDKTWKAIGLRDVIMMKPGSTVEDLFLTLKRMGALSGEFIRAEATGEIGSAPKPIPKAEMIARSTCIIKVMTSKRSSWQNRM